MAEVTSPTKDIAEWCQVLYQHSFFKLIFFQTLYFPEGFCVVNCLFNLLQQIKPFFFLVLEDRSRISLIYFTFTENKLFRNQRNFRWISHDLTWGMDLWSSLCTSKSTIKVLIGFLLRSSSVIFSKTIFFFIQIWLLDILAWCTTVCTYTGDHSLKMFILKDLMIINFGTKVPNL